MLYEPLNDFIKKMDINLKEIDLIHMLFNKGIYKYNNIIVTGKFGIIFNNLYNNSFNIIVTPDNLNEFDYLDLSYIKDKIYGNTFIFVDNDFYTGRIRDIIFNEILRLGGYICYTYCIYDGSDKIDDKVISLFNCHNNKNIKKYICKECKNGYNDAHIVITDFENIVLCPYCFCEINDL